MDNLHRLARVGQFEWRNPLCYRQSLLTSIIQQPKFVPKWRWSECSFAHSHSLLWLCQRLQQTPQREPLVGQKISAAFVILYISAFSIYILSNFLVNNFMVSSLSYSKRKYSIDPGLSQFIQSFISSTGFFNHSNEYSFIIIIFLQFFW